MKIKNSEAVTKYMALSEIMGRKEKYPVKFAFALSKNLKALEALNKDFEEARNGLLDEYNVRDESGEPAYKNTGKIQIAPEHGADWRNAMEELLEIEVEASVQKVELSVLDGMEVAPDVLYACDFMFAE